MYSSYLYTKYKLANVVINRLKRNWADFTNKPTLKFLPYGNFDCYKVKTPCNILKMINAFI